MYKLTFDEKPEANTYVKWARGKGYMVEGPYKEKLAKTAKKKFDLNGKPKKYAFAVLRQRGAGYQGGYLPGQHRVHFTEREIGTSKPAKPAASPAVAVVEPTITEPSVQPATATPVYKAPVQTTKAVVQYAVSASATFPLVPPASGSGYEPSGRYYYMNGKWWDFTAPGVGSQQEVDPATGKLVNPAPAGAPANIPTADYSEHVLTPLPLAGTPEGDWAQANPVKYKLYKQRVAAGAKEIAPWQPKSSIAEDLGASLGSINNIFHYTGKDSTGKDIWEFYFPGMEIFGGRADAGGSLTQLKDGEYYYMLATADTTIRRLADNGNTYIIPLKKGQNLVTWTPFKQFKRQSTGS